MGCGNSKNAVYEVNDEEHGKKQGTGTASEGNVNNNQDQNSDNKTTPGAVNQSTPNKATLPNNVSKTLADQSTAGGNPTFSITVSPPEPLTSKELTCLKVTDDATGATKGIPCECPPILKFQAKPVKIDLLEAMETYEETFKLCRCGYSSNFPYCDNSHEKLDSWKEGVLPPPLSMDLEIYDRMVEEGKLTQTDEEKEKEERILLICACGHSKLWRDMPICDGTCKELVKVSE